MSELLRGILGNVSRAEADDGTGAGGGAGAGVEGSGGADNAGGGDGTDGAAAGAGNDGVAGGESGDGPAPTMFDAITEGLAANAEAAAKPAPEPKAKPAAKVEGEAAAEIDPATGKPKVAAEAKPEDPLYKMPDGLQPQGRQRFQALVEGHKKIASEYETVKAQLAKVQPEYQAVLERQNAFRDILKETQTAPQELNQFLTFNQLVKTGQYDKAIPILKEQLRLLSLATGKNQGGDIDPLQGFDDLRSQVDEHRITEEAALELARARMDRQAREQAATAQQQNNDTQAQATQARADGIKAVQDWSLALSTKSLDYKAKEPKLLEALDEVMESYPPHLWVKTLETLYKTISVPKAASGSGDNPKPLRPSGGGGSKAPSNMAEAISQGLGYQR